MKLNLPLIALAVVAAALVAVVIFWPNWIGDSNVFLKEFVSLAYLGVVGVIVTITLASLSQAHLNLNRIEERRGRECFTQTRKEIKDTACWLIGLFAAALLIVIVKPLVCITEMETAGANAGAIFILVLYMLILFDITMAVLDIKPDIGGTTLTNGDHNDAT